MAKKKPKKKELILVIDASLTMAWCFDDEANPYADAVAKKFPGIQAVAPPHWPLEVATALVMGERRKRSTRHNTTNWVTFLSGLPITVEDQSALVAWGDTLNLARTHNLSAYDAAYLELALRRGLPFATLDQKLKTAAETLGIPLFTP